MCIRDSPEGITLEEAKKILAKARKEKLPIVDKDFNLKGLITIKDIEKTIKYPLAAKDAQGRLLCGAGVGITANVLDRVAALAEAKVDVIVLDSAHGHSENVLRCLRMIKEDVYKRQNCCSAWKHRSPEKFPCSGARQDSLTKRCSHRKFFICRRKCRSLI